MATDENLLDKVIRFDDEDAFHSIFSDYYPPLCLYAGRMVAPMIAEDVVQEVFVTLWETRHTLTIDTSLKGYLLASTRNRCLNHIKREAVQNRYTDYATANHSQPMRADDLLSVSELENRLEQTLSQMREEWRVAFVMSHMQHKKTSEIAERLGVSERSVERFRKKAMDIIEREMRDYAPLLMLVMSQLPS